MRWALLVGLTLLSQGLAAPDPKGQIKAQCEAVKVVVEFWHGFRGGAPEAALDKAVLEFNKLQAGKGCVKPSSKGSYGGVFSKVSAGEKNRPALAQATDAQVALYQRAELLEPLNFSPNINPLLSRTVKIKGRFYGLPFNKSLQLLYFNRDLLKKYGAKAPATLEELISTAQRISKAEGQPVYWFTPDVSTFSYWFFNLGGDYLQSGKLVLNSGAGMRALETLVKGINEGWARGIPYGYINAQFDSGMFGFAIDSSAGLSYYVREAKFKVGVSPVPGANAKKSGYSLMQGANLIIFKSAPAEEKKLAMRFLEYATRVQPDFAAATNYVPISSSKGNARLATLSSQLRTARFEPSPAIWEQIRSDVLGQAIRDAVAGKFTPKAVLDAAQKSVDAGLKR